MDELIKVRDLKKYFAASYGKLHAVDGLSFSIQRGKTLGVVGESGCGKSTLGRALIGLLDVTEGEVIFKSRDITHAKGRERKALCREMQMIFQDPFSSLDPRLCAFDLIAEPLLVFKVCKTRDELESRVSALMETVGISKQMAYSYPYELDGGRRQRIGIARALALEPDFIVCDEPVSALDVSVQAQFLNLLKKLQLNRGLTYLFITHDLSVVKHISDDILVMYMGQMVEKAPSKKLFEAPLHPYTKGLLSAIPIPKLRSRRERIIMKGEITYPIDPKPGCRFAARCPYARELCFRAQPELVQLQPEHYVACHFVEEINGLSAG